MTTTSDRADFIARMAARQAAGNASYGAECFYANEDVTDECRRRAEAYGATRAAGGLLVREYEFVPVAGDDALDELVGRCVAAYAAVWGPIRERDESGRWVWRSLTRDSFGAIDVDALPLLRDHEGQRLGRFLEVEADDYGLRTVALYDDSPAARRVLDDIRDGRIACYSVRVATHETLAAGARDGEPVHEVVRATLLDAGPASGVAGSPLVGPADTRARILAIGEQLVDPAAAAAHRAMRITATDPDGAELGAMSVSQLADEIAWFVGGDRLRELSDDIDFKARRKGEAVGEQVCRIERAVSALRKARTSAEHSYGWWLRHGRHPADWREFVAFDAEADGHEAWLREHTYAETYRVLTAGIPAKITLQQRLRDLATHGRNHR